MLTIIENIFKKENETKNNEDLKNEYGSEI